MIAHRFRYCMRKNGRLDNGGRELALPLPCVVCGKDCFRLDTVTMLVLHRLPCSAVYHKAQAQLREETTYADSDL